MASEWREWRRKHHLTQAEFARALGMSLRAVKYVEAGKSKPQLRNRQAFRDLVERYREAEKLTRKVDW